MPRSGTNLTKLDKLDLCQYKLDKAGSDLNTFNDFMFSTYNKLIAFGNKVCDDITIIKMFEYDGKKWRSLYNYFTAHVHYKLNKLNYEFEANKKETKEDKIDE